jgi:hypothetical protein
MKLHGFAFVSYPIQIDSSLLPFSFDNILVFDKPTEEELKMIRKNLDEMHGIQDFKRPFEAVNYREEGHGEDFHVMNFKKLDEKDWLYNVIRFVYEGPEVNPFWNKPISKLQLASLTQSKKIRIGPTFYNELKSKSGRFTEDWEHFSYIHNDIIDNVWNSEDLEKLKVAYEKICTLEIDYPDLYRSLKLLDSIPKFVGFNEFMNLSLFSVIESVLTHAPKSDSDSITHQIKTKVNLLSKRFDVEIDYSSFGGANDDTIWKKLYEFRSRIAHGGNIDFQKSLSILKDSYTVQLFLENFLSTMLRNAINDPELYVDLKKC